MKNIREVIKTKPAVELEQGLIYTGIDNLEVLKQIPDNTVDCIYGDILYFTNKVWEKNGWKFDDRFDSMWHFLFFNAERFVELKRIMRTRRYQLVDNILYEDGEVCSYEPRRDKILSDYSGKGKIKKLEKTGVDVGASIFTHLDYRSNSEVKTFIKDPLFGEGKGAMTWDMVQDIFERETGERVPEPISVPKVDITQGGDIVLDCWGGSHSTAATAWKLGRRFISIELNKSEQLFLDQIEGVKFSEMRTD